jgi:hypothetical protein
MKMTSNSELPVVEPVNRPLSESDRAVLDRFSQMVTARAEALAQGAERARVIDLIKRAVAEVQEALAVAGGAGSARSGASSGQLPVSKLKASEVVGEGWVELSQASFYRAVESRRFYSVTPAGRSIGKVFPAWQFLAPVPELIAPVLMLFDDMPGSEIHAFWVGGAAELNELSPAEVLAGLPFASRQSVDASQWAVLRLPTNERARKVTELAGWRLRGMADVVG